MPLFGTLGTMPLQDLLHWLGANAKSGTLRIECERVSKCVLLREGRIFGCTSNDPPEKLGHFLLSRGRVTEAQLREALNSQEISRKYLGEQFVALGVLTENELASHLQAQAAETIFGLFDWDEAVFRFSEELEEQPKAFRVDLDIDEVVARGLERAAEVRQIREVFPDKTVILRKTARRLPREALSNSMARTLYDAIVDDRSLAELLLQVHGSEYLVTKFLHALHSSGLIEVHHAPTAAPAATAVAEPAMAVSVAVEGAIEGALESAMGPSIESAVAASGEAGHCVAEVAAPTATEAPPKPESHDLPEVSLNRLSTDAENDEGDGETQGAELLDIPEVFVESSDMEAIEDSVAYQTRRKLALARKHLHENKHEKAIAILEDLFRKNPDDEPLGKLLAAAEASFIDRAYRHCVPASKIPSLRYPIECLETEKLSPTEFFLISRMNGRWDVKSIIQIAPLREVDVLITLKRLRENGVVEFKDPAV